MRFNTCSPSTCSNCTTVLASTQAPSLAGGTAIRCHGQHCTGSMPGHALSKRICWRRLSAWRCTACRASGASTTQATCHVQALRCTNLPVGEGCPPAAAACRGSGVRAQPPRAPTGPRPRRAPSRCGAKLPAPRQQRLRGARRSAQHRGPVGACLPYVRPMAVALTTWVPCR
jgi:hypothetical protein